MKIIKCSLYNSEIECLDDFMRVRLAELYAATDASLSQYLARAAPVLRISPSLIWLMLGRYTRLSLIFLETGARSYSQVVLTRVTTKCSLRNSHRSIRSHFGLTTHVNSEMPCSGAIQKHT